MPSLFYFLHIFVLCDHNPNTYSCNRQLFCVERNIHGSNITVYCSEIQAWYDSGGFESRDTGCNVEECRQGMIKEATQGGSREPRAINNSTTVS